MDNKNPQKNLSAQIRHIISIHKETTITLGALLGYVEDKSFGILLMLISLPSALPIPAPGYSTPFGLILLALGTEMLLGRHQPWVPKRAKATTLRIALLKKMLQGSERILKLAERLVKPRLLLFSTPLAHKALGAIITLMACCMILPIPLTNTAPAMVIFLAGMALLEGDGLLILLSIILGLLGVCAYSFILYILFTYGIDGVLEIKEAVFQWILNP